MHEVSGSMRIKIVGKTCEEGVDDGKHSVEVNEVIVSWGEFKRGVGRWSDFSDSELEW